MGGLLRLLVGVGLTLQVQAVQRIHSLVDTPSSDKYLEAMASLTRLPGPSVTAHGEHDLRLAFSRKLGISKSQVQVSRLQVQ
jgi:hypothetical protein